jgi:uncharacterized protein YndB with AHSA1/START domain
MTTEHATMDASTDRIERSITINAPRAKVWRALTNAEESGTWFGADLKGQRFAPGQRARGPITFKGYEHLFFDVVVDRMQPEDLMSYRWHPYAHDPKVDYTKEEPTLVTFTLKETPGNGTLLTVVETGFDRLPPERRMETFRMNTLGWGSQTKKLAAHVEK